MLKMKLQYFNQLLRSADPLEDPDARKDCKQKEKGATDDAMVGRHLQLNGHEFEQTVR